MNTAWSRTGHLVRGVRRPGRRAARMAAAVAVVLAACAAAIPPAFADYGGLVFDGCIGNHAGCTATYPAGALNGATAFVLYRGNVYAATDYGITTLHADTAGNLTYASCTGNLNGCIPVPVYVGITGYLVQSNGQLYLASMLGGRVAHFTIDQAGTPLYDNCVGHGCATPWPPDALHGATSLAVTPDGRHLYVGGTYGVSHYLIDQAGNLTFDGCIGTLPGCTTPYPGYADDMVVTPDGENLYVSAYYTNAVVHYLIDQAGNLIYAGCIGDNAGCTPITAGALDGPHGLAVTPDGAHLYVTASGNGGGNAVSHFTIDPAGNLTYAGCIGDHAGCTPITGGALDGAASVAITPTIPLSLYAGARSAISHFAIDQHGNLIYAGCIGTQTGCTPTTPAGVFNLAWGLAIDHAGTSLYAGGLFGNAVTHFMIAGF